MTTPQSTIYQGWYGAPQPPQPPPPPPMLGPRPPRHGEPGFTVWPHRIWPFDPLAAAPRRLLVPALIVGVVSAEFWRVSVLSVGYLLVGVMVFGVVYGTAERRPTRGEWLGITVTLALLTVPTLLAAKWLGVLCILAAWLVGWSTLAGGRTWTAIFTGPFLPLLPARAFGWARRAIPEGGLKWSGRPSPARVAVVGTVTVVLALVFGGLFTSADPAFARVIERLTPEWNPYEAYRYALAFWIVLSFVLFGAYLVRFAPKLDALAPRPMRAVPSWEWAVPLAVLDVLFIGFVAVQATVLFGGHAHVLETDGLTYAEYARQGFWQLLWVSALTLLVLSAVIRVAGREAASDRRLLRILVGILCATSVVVVISAIHRMWLYQQAYGFSTERLMVITIELWLGAVFILVAVAGLRMTGRWLPRAILMAGAVALLGLAATNPERLIAERNIDRYEQTGVLDAAYLLRLSSDIEPALARLPESMRVCAMYRNDDRGPWYEFNLSRWRAPHDGTPQGDACSKYGLY
jgi:MFS family permease